MICRTHTFIVAYENDQCASEERRYAADRQSGSTDRPSEPLTYMLADFAEGRIPVGMSMDDLTDTLPRSFGVWEMTRFVADTPEDHRGCFWIRANQFLLHEMGAQEVLTLSPKLMPKVLKRLGYETRGDEHTTYLRRSRLRGACAPQVQIAWHSFGTDDAGGKSTHAQLSKQSLIFDLGTAILNDGQPGRCCPGGRLVMADANLHPYHRGQRIQASRASSTMSGTASGRRKMSINVDWVRPDRLRRATTDWPKSTLPRQARD